MEDAMGKINYARVFLGGLLAGVIFIVGVFSRTVSFWGVIGK
jgi:hypothetical protein